MSFADRGGYVTTPVLLPKNTKKRRVHPEDGGNPSKEPNQRRRSGRFTLSATLSELRTAAGAQIE